MYLFVDCLSTRMYHCHMEPTFFKHVPRKKHNDTYPFEQLAIGEAFAVSGEPLPLLSSMRSYAYLRGKQFGRKFFVEESVLDNKKSYIVSRTR